MTTSINWSRKPDWADVWIESFDKHSKSQWAKSSNDDWILATGLSFWRKADESPQWYKVHYPPANKVIPPVGWYGQCTWGAKNAWVECVILPLGRIARDTSQGWGMYDIGDLPNLDFRPFEWNGKGVPPVGTVCEVRVIGAHNDQFVEFTVTSVTDNFIIGYVTGNSKESALNHKTPYVTFRQLQSDKEKWVEQAARVLLKEHSKISVFAGDPTKFIDKANAIYEAIESGELPGIIK